MNILCQFIVDINDLDKKAQYLSEVLIRIYFCFILPLSTFLRSLNQNFSCFILKIKHCYNFEKTRAQKLLNLKHSQK